MIMEVTKSMVDVVAIKGNFLMFLKQIFIFYKDGFKNMNIGKKLWLIIAIKLFIFIFVLKLFFFPNILQTQFSNDQDRSNFVIENLIKK